MADLEEFAGFALRPTTMLRAPSSVFDISFSQYTCLPAFRHVNRVRRVPEVGRRDDDRVELFLLVEHLAVVFVAVGLLLEPLEGVDDAPLVVLRPDVAHRAEAQARDAEHRFHQHLALSPGAEQGDVDLLETRRGDRSRGCRLLPASSVLLLAAPRVAEEPQRRDRGQPHEHVAPIELRLAPWPPRAASLCPSRPRQPSLVSCCHAPGVVVLPAEVYPRGRWYVAQAFRPAVRSEWQG